MYYNLSTSHWLLHEAKISNHTSNLTATRNGSEEYSTQYDDDGGGPLEWVDKEGGPLTIWVAEGKHANNFSQSQCGGNGFAGSDTCANNLFRVRENILPLYNLGSRSTSLIDCVETRNTNHPHYGTGRQECFWTPVNFRGWYDVTVGGGQGGLYTDKLAEYGF